MGYEEDYKKPYKAKCACGRGYLRYYETTYSNDWNQSSTEVTPIEFECEFCSKQFHIEKGYLVPNGMTMYIPHPKYDKKYDFTTEENIVRGNNKDALIRILCDMKKPGHGFIAKLESQEAKDFANERVRWGHSKRIKEFIPELEYMIDNYESILCKYKQKEEYQAQYRERVSKYDSEIKSVQDQSFNLKFVYDQELVDQEAEKHKYDEFYARVSYDPTYGRNLETTYWDTYFIKKCVDDEYLILEKGYDARHIIITKKYLCECMLCGREKIINSCDFEILYNYDGSSCLKVYCECHRPSSFEVKTMDILNRLGVSYIREKVFEDLAGDFNKPLRFDFAIFKERDGNGIPIIDFVLELQGPHHFQPGRYDELGNFSVDMSRKDELEKQKRYDNLKEQYCIDHGIYFASIKYSHSGCEDILKKVKEALNNLNYDYKKYDEENDDEVPPF